MLRSTVSNAENVLFQGEDSEVNHALLAKTPLEVLVIEYTVLEPSSSGIKNALVLTDVFKKDTQVFPTMNQKPVHLPKC